MGCGCNKHKRRDFELRIKSKSVIIRFGWSLGEGCREQISELLGLFPEISEIRFRGSKMSLKCPGDFDLDFLKEKLRDNLFEVVE